MIAQFQAQPKRPLSSDTDRGSAQEQRAECPTTDWQTVDGLSASYELVQVSPLAWAISFNALAKADAPISKYSMALRLLPVPRSNAARDVQPIRRSKARTQSALYQTTHENHLSPAPSSHCDVRRCEPKPYLPAPILFGATTSSSLQRC